MSEQRTQGTLIGASLGGYQVEALIGRGAMGSVYLARDIKLNRHVALKVLLGSLARTPSIVKQFHQEAQAAAPLNHPGIVRIYSAGIEDGTPYIAMEFVDGEPLDRFLARKGKVAWDLALHLGGQVAQALERAHMRGIVHRDVKPSNILLDRKGNVRLTDFGIARVQSDETGPNEIIGTPQFMSPEQVTGREVGPASDLFSLGVTLYQLISGEAPFRAESSMGLVKSICEDEPPRLNRLIPSVPDDVARLVAYLMEKDPQNRPANAHVTYELIRRLQKQRGGHSVVGEALTAFIQDQMEPRPFSSVAEKQANARRQDSKIRRREQQRRRKKQLRRYAVHAVGILLLSSAALAAGPVAANWSRDRATGPAPLLDLATVHEVDEGLTRVLFFTDGFALADLAWTPDSAGLLITARGERGQLTDGLAGVMAFNPETGDVHSLLAPSVSVEGTRFAFSEPWAAANAPNLYVLASDPGENRTLLLGQHWTDAAPGPQVMHAFETVRHRTGTGVSGPGGIAVNPRGDRVCVYLEDGNGPGYLVEQPLSSWTGEGSGRRRTSYGGAIVPESVQYTPDGDRIAYLREGSDGTLELWVLISDGADLNGRRILGGIGSEDLAFSPDGALVLLELEQDGVREVVLVDSRQGTVVASLGPGRVSSSAWTSSGDGFVFVSDPGPGDGVPQLVWASRETPDCVTRLTSLRDGVRPVYAMASDGSHAAVVGNGNQMPTLYVVDVAMNVRGE